MSRLLIAALLGVGACAPASTPTTAARPGRVAVPIAAEELRRDLSAFAADSMRGRETGSGDDLRAARFIAARLASLGVEPAGDSGYFQRVPLTALNIARSSRVTVTTPNGPVTLAIGGDVVPLTTMGSGAQNPKLNAEADLVFASYGIADPALRRDDFAGLDLAGKAVVVVVDAPPGADSAAVARYTGQSGLQMRVGRLLGAQPAAIVLVLAGPKGEDLYHQAASSLVRSMTMRDTSPVVPDEDRMLPTILIARVTPGSALLPSDWPTNDKARALTGRRLAAHITVTRDQQVSYNVVGIVRGTSQPSTYVAYGAHLDHVGVGSPVNGDSIYNGADDDGSGSVTLLALARSFAMGPRPARSLLFVWHTGEEKGLFGSQWFTSHPTVPLDSIVAQLNADMVGRNHPDSLYIVGPAAAPRGQGRVLGALVDSVNGAMRRPFAFNREWDSPTHPERIYYRSDHFMYAQKGIPIVFFTTGLHADYHKPSDEVSKIDFEKMARVGELLRQAGWAVASRPSRPKS